MSTIAALDTFWSHKMMRAKMSYHFTTLDTAHFTLSFPNLVFALIAQGAFILEFFVWAAITIFVSAFVFDFTMRAGLTYFAVVCHFVVFAPTAFRAVYLLTTMRTLVGVNCNVLDQLAKLIFSVHFNILA